MEKDDELSGEGNSYDFGERMYNPRIGRWSSTDPFEDRMPQVSPYSFALNNPVYLVDEDGEIPIIPFLIKASAAAATDALLQASMIYLTDDTVEDFGAAFKKIDKSDVAWSFVEGLNPFKVPGGKLGEAAAVATADVLIYIGEQTLDGNDITASAVGGEFLIGFFSQLAGDKAAELLSNKTVRNKLGDLLGADELNKMLKKAADDLPAFEKQLQDIADGVRLNNPGKGNVPGIKAHSEFQEKVDALGFEDVHTEINFLDGEKVIGNKKGSSRLDVFVGNPDTPSSGTVYDLKTGGAKVTPKQTKKTNKNLDRKEGSVNEIKPTSDKKKG